MECKNCGYKKGFFWEEDSNGDSNFVEINPTGEKFKKIKGSFFAESEDSFSGSHEVQLYACPKCSVVILED